MTDQLQEMLEALREPLSDKYEMQSLLGAGGMGAVYLARDIKHDRSVAIKVLHPEFAQSLGAERFLREVSVTAKLSHPHILPLYDSGDANGFLYYVMPLIEGEDLGDRITREKQLPIKDAVLIAKEVAEALGYAHSMGLVHRDIKPGNIMLSGGHAIVVDFGIARAVDAAGGEKITQTGMSVGTPAYMSPEQSSGEEVDARADLYSLGCVLYEMLVGQIPFTGPTPMAIMARHTMDTVPPPTIMREAIPDELEDVIMQAMAKTPADRFQTGMEMTEALDMVDVYTAMHRRPSIAMRQSGMMRKSVVGRQSAMFDIAQPWWRRALVPGVAGLTAVGIAAGAWAAFGRSGGTALGSGLDPQRIAVLYFDDLSSDGALSGIADGLAEELIEELQRANVTVTSANGVRPYRGSNVARDSIARALGVGTLVVGTLEQRPGDSVLITTRIVDGSTLENIGDPDRSTVSSSEITLARDSVVADVSLRLRTRIGRDVSLRASRRRTDNAEAYAAYRRAVRTRQEAQAMLATGEDGIEPLLLAADSLLALAEGGDDQWVDPIVERGWLALDQSGLASGRATAATVARMGMEHAERAIALDRRSAAAWHLRGSLRWQLYGLRAVETEEEWNQLLFSARDDLDSATTLNPTLAEAYATKSYVLYEPQIGDVAGAMGAAETGYQQDQFVANANELIHASFWGNLDLENFNQADRWCTRGSQRYPDRTAFRLCQLWLMVTPRDDADTARARQLVAALDSIVPDIPNGRFESTLAHIVMGGILGKAGDTTAARIVLEQMDQQASFEIDPDQELGGRIAYMYTLFDLDRAVDYVKAYVVANPHHHFVEAAGTVWWWRELRDHPRWSEIAALGGG